MIFAVPILDLIIFVVCAYIVQSTWANGYGDRFGQQMIDQINVLSRVWPSRGSDLTFSMLRHMVAAIIVCVVTFVVRAGWILTGLQVLMLLYTFSSLWLYKQRKADYRDQGDASRDALKPALKACTVSVVYKVIIMILVYVAYYLRP